MILTVDRKQIEPNIEVFTLHGRVVLGRESQALEWQVEELLRQNRSRLVFDMTDVSFIDSAGLGILVGCLGKVKAAGGGLKMIGPSDRVRQIFRMTGVEALFSLHASVPEAVASFAAAA